MEFAKIGRAFTLCVIYIILSGGLIEFNKYLLNKKRFPHAMFLTACHMFVTSTVLAIVYLIRPSMFPGVEVSRGRRMFLSKCFIPLGMLFAVALFTSNRAYLYCNAAFLQFMKEANVVILFLMSASVGLQVVSRARVVNIGWIIAGAAISVQGEVQFAMTGFILQLVSQLHECGRNVLGEWIMNGSDLKLDPLTYSMFMAPVCLIPLSIGTIYVWDATTWPDIMVWWPYLLPNSFIAVALNLCISMIIKETSAMAFILTGLVKDICIVFVSSHVFGEEVITQQYLGFILCLSGIFMWSYSKISPDAAFVQLFNKVCFSDPGDSKAAKTDETKPLLPKENSKETSV